MGIIELDKALFILINSNHNPLCDLIMEFCSNQYSFIGLYVAIIFYIFYKKNLKKAILGLLAIIVVFALCDSLSVALFKDVFQRLKPAHDPDFAQNVRLLEYMGGKYGFISSHASNVFGLASISSLIFRKKSYTYFIYFWAFIVSYSRVYVGKHYPLDVICGAIFGVSIGLIIYYIYKKIIEKIDVDNIRQ